MYRVGTPSSIELAYGHHVVGVLDQLRAGGVKARRPLASAVEAERRALHAAEQSASIQA